MSEPTRQSSSIEGRPAGEVRAIVLAGTRQWDGTAFARVLPRQLLPVAHAPLVSYALAWLRDAGVTRATVCTNWSSRLLRASLPDALRDGGLRLDYYEDWMPRGPAGCARDAAAAGPERTLVLVEGAIVPTVDLGTVLATHRASRAAATVVVAPEGLGADPGMLEPAGIYVVESRALGLVPASGFQDLKEALVPRLHAAGQRIGLYAAPEPCPRVRDLPSYLAVNEWVLERVVAGEYGLAGYVRRDGELVLHPSARVDAGARLVGPVLVGPAALVRRGATIVGPAVIGAGSTVVGGAVVSRSILWSRCAVGAGVSIDRSVIADGAALQGPAELHDIVKIAAGPRGGPETPRGSLARRQRTPRPLSREGAA